MYFLRHKQQMDDHTAYQEHKEWITKFYSGQTATSVITPSPPLLCKMTGFCYDANSSLDHSRRGDEGMYTFRVFGVCDSGMSP